MTNWKITDRNEHPEISRYWIDRANAAVRRRGATWEHDASLREAEPYEFVENPSVGTLIVHGATGGMLSLKSTSDHDNDDDDDDNCRCYVSDRQSTGCTSNCYGTMIWYDTGVPYPLDPIDEDTM